METIVYRTRVIHCDIILNKTQYQFHNVFPLKYQCLAILKEGTVSELSSVVYVTRKLACINAVYLWHIEQAQIWTLQCCKHQVSY